jgi:hypothetical protein
MGEAKWTPGPWREDTHNTVFSRSGEDYKIIATVPDHPRDEEFSPAQSKERGEWYIESGANRVLIAAAPELYEALEALRSHGRNHPGLHIPGLVCERCLDHVEQYLVLEQRAALALAHARGEKTNG